MPIRLKKKKKHLVDRDSLEEQCFAGRGNGLIAGVFPYE